MGQPKGLQQRPIEPLQEVRCRVDREAELPPIGLQGIGCIVRVDHRAATDKATSILLGVALE